jgi:energy-coupling factor transporter ATP-binding protein EcfA2
MYTLTDVSKTYHKGRAITALRGVNLVIGDGEWLAVQGRTGHGKTTLLQILGGLDRPSTGTVTFAGQDLGRLRETLAQIGLICAPLRLRQMSTGSVANRAACGSRSVPRCWVRVPYSSGRRPASQRRPVDSGTSPRSRPARTISSPAAQVSARIRP